MTPKSPYRLLSMFALALFGLFISGYLVTAYLKIAELACTDTGCDVIRGWHDQRLPHAFLPLLGSAFFLALTALTYKLGTSPKNGKALATAILALAGAGTLAVAGLTWIEHKLGTYCFWCMLVAGTTVLSFILSVFEWRAWRKETSRYELDFEPYLKWGVAPVIIGLIMISSVQKSEVSPSPTPENSGFVGGNTPSEGNAVTTTAPTPNGPPITGTNPVTDPNALFNTSNIPAASQRASDAEIATRLKRVVLIPADAHVRGPKNAKITLVEFADPGCSHCADQAPIVEKLLSLYPRDLRLVYRHFPLKSHLQSREAAEAMEAAGAQGKFWEMRDTLFRNLGAQTEPDLIRHAKTIGLNVDRFTKDLQSHKYAARVTRDRDTGDTLGVSSTPTLILNDKVHSGPLSLEILTAAVKMEMKNKKPGKTS